MFAIRIVQKEMWVYPASRSDGWPRPMSISSWLTAPPWNWNRNLKMTPVTISGTSQGTMISDRANVRPGNVAVNSSASAKPMMNWPGQASRS